ncbi:MAG: hypothetical protein V1494_05190 [Candidatus Diapherotrites archaeon]
MRKRRWKGRTKKRDRGHPRKTLYEKKPEEARFVGLGKEAVIYRLPGKGVVHKYWRQAWILANYKMLDSKGLRYEQAARRAQKGFESDMHGHTIEKKGHSFHGLPIKEFGKITFILSKTTEDILKRAGKVGIPVPRIAETILHPKQPLYILKLSDLSKEGCDIISGELLSDPRIQSVISNYSELQRAIRRDTAKLYELGYEQDIDLHPPNSAWLIRINKKTGKAERFLWDATNLKSVKPHYTSSEIIKVIADEAKKNPIAALKHLQTLSLQQSTKEAIRRLVERKTGIKLNE